MPAPRTRFAVVDCDCRRYIRPHGTAHCYNHHKCGCDPCHAAGIREVRERRRQPRLILADTARARIDLLQAHGMTIAEISRVSGWGYSTVYQIARKSVRKTSRAFTEDMASIPIPRPTERLCEVEGCKRIHKARGLCGFHYQRSLRGSTGTRATRTAPQSAVDRLAELEWLLDNGSPLVDAAPRVGWKATAAREAARKYRPDLLPRLNALLAVERSAA